MFRLNQFRYVGPEPIKGSGQEDEVRVYLLSWKSLVKNFSTLLQNFAERFSLAVAIMIWTSSPLKVRVNAWQVRGTVWAEMLLVLYWCGGGK